MRSEMSSPSDRAHLDEWAALVGERVPDDPDREPLAGLADEET
jgi:hypothetical protein